MRFPHDSVPDGDAAAPHHFWPGAFLAVFGFGFVWSYYPVAGALCAILGTLVMADDVASHAFGVWTPLDSAFAYLVSRGWVR